MSALTDPTTPSPFPTRRHFWQLVAALVFLLVFGYGWRPLDDPDEGRYTNIPLHMLMPGADWMEPRQSGIGHYDKPPLLYWFEAVSLKVFGKNEWAARLPCMLGAFMALGGLGWAAARLYGRETAWWSLLVCGTLAQFWFMARLLTTDMLLTGWVALAIGAWAEARARGCSWRWWALCLAFWSLAWWTKATPALIPLAGLVIGTWALRDVEGRKALRPGLLLPGILLLGCGWFVTMMVRFPDLVDFFFGRELVGRFASDIHRRGEPFYFHLLLAPALWMPWLPVVGVLVWRWRRELFPTGWKAWRRAPGWEGWIVVTGLTVFSLARSKLATYTVLLAPWAAMLLARGLLGVRPCLGPTRFKTIARRTVIFIACLMLLVSIGAPILQANGVLRSMARQASEVAKARGAETLVVDRMLPSFQFYFGDRVMYLTSRDRRQRPDDRPSCAELPQGHYQLTNTWEAAVAGLSNVWMVVGGPLETSSFRRFLASHPEAERIPLKRFILVRYPGPAGMGPDALGPQTNPSAVTE